MGKKLTGVGAFFICLMIVMSAVAQHDYQSIQQIIAETPERWTESYKTKWRQVDIDVKIRLPEASQFPVIKVHHMPPASKEVLAAYRLVRRNEKGMLEANIHGQDQVIGKDWRRKSSHVFGEGEVPDILPENSQLSFEDAADLLFSEMERLFGLHQEDFSLRQTQVDSAFYRYTGSGDHIVWKERVTDSGRYLFTLRQQFRGIPYQPAKACYDPQTGSRGNEKNIRNGTVYARIESPDEFRIVSQLFAEKDLIVDDIPLLPFTSAKKAFEKEIMAGRLRSIDSLELCYIPYLDPKDDQVFWLLPAWVLKGGYTRDPKRGFTPHLDPDSGQVVDDGIERLELVYQAQLGSLLDYADKRNNRRAVPKIITWQNIK